VGLVVDWGSPDPAALGARLADRLRLPRPDPSEDRFALLLAGGVVRVARTAPGVRERLVAVAAFDEAPTSALDGVRLDHAALDASPGVRLLGVAWATVEMARGTRELADRFGLGQDDFALAADDAWLGAAARGARLGRSMLVALEPTTEGRVAAALARFGEGPVAIYIGLPGPALGLVRRGPLGAGSLMTGSPVWGPFAIVLAEPAEAVAPAAD
jgi:hypothetical protein